MCFKISAVIVAGEVAAFMIARGSGAVGAKDSMTRKATIAIGEMAFMIARATIAIGEIVSMIRKAISYIRTCSIL